VGEMRTQWQAIPLERGVTLVFVVWSNFQGISCLGHCKKHRVVFVAFSTVFFFAGVF